MIRVLYATNANLALRRGHAKNILKTAEALAESNRVACRIIAPSGMGALIRARRTFDVLYLRDHYLIVQACVAKYVLGKKVVYEIHSTHGWYLLRRFLFAIADAAIFITKRLQTEYDPGTQKPAAVVHAGGVDLAEFSVADTKQALRSALKLPPRAYLAVYVGSNVWYDMAVLIDMLSLVQSDVVLVLGGIKEDEAMALRERARLLGVEDRLLCPGRIAWDEVPRYLLSADVLVNPLSATLPGSISSKLYEYLAAGRPIVSTRGGANDEVLRHEENALLVECTKERFADAINRLRGDSGLAEHLSAEAREDARQYTWQERARNIADIIDMVMK